MLRETERDEQIAAARRLPKDAVIQVTDATATYEPAVKTDATVQAKTDAQAAANTPVITAALSNTTTTAAATPQSTDANRVAASLQTDTAAPQPKSAAITPGQQPPAKQTTDVSTALKTLVASTADVSTTSQSAKQEAPVTPITDLVAKSPLNSTSVRSPEAAASIMEVSLSPDKTDLKVGDKQQLQLRVKSDAPLGMALVTLRFDPKVLKVNSISLGDLFANAKTAPTLTQSVDEHGMILISLTPASGSAVTADGSLINIDLEALTAGDSTLGFDLSNVHVVASDGRPLLLQIEPIKLTVK
jgi:Cohesin domain